MGNNKEYKALQDEYWANIQKEAQGYLEKVEKDGSELNLYQKISLTKNCVMLQLSKQVEH